MKRKLFLLSTLFLVFPLITTSCKKKASGKGSLKWVKYNCKVFCKKSKTICKDHIKKKLPKWTVGVCAKNCVAEFVLSPKRVANQIARSAKFARTCQKLLQLDNYGAIYSYAVKKEKNFAWATKQCETFCDRAGVLCKDKIEKNKKKGKVFDKKRCAKSCLKKYKKHPSAITNRLYCSNLHAKTCKEWKFCNRCGETKCLSRKQIHKNMMKTLRKNWLERMKKRKAFLEKLKKAKAAKDAKDGKKPADNKKDKAPGTNDKKAPDAAGTKDKKAPSKKTPTKKKAPAKKSPAKKK